ncbi:MAG: hypothetical protein DWH91_04265 [Planctomycetota bacterium]|nr:MAG: hypothetical protein DWH91_04265 [Planctomycetota bacterium]
MHVIKRHTGWVVWGITLGGLLLSGCSPDIKGFADQMVANDYLKSGSHVAAIPFFEGGGHFYDQDASTHVDREVILPLLKKLHAAQSTDQWVVPDPQQKRQAIAVLIELPKDQAQVDALAQIVEQADAQFEGMILQQWGHQWLSIDLIDKASAEFFQQADPNFDKQR